MADTQYGPLQPKQQSASDIRKVIANATKTTGKGYTIANNDELKEQKDKKEQKQVKVSTPSGTATRTNTNVETPKVQTSTVKEVPQGPTPFPVIDKSQLTGDIFKNPQLQGIKNIPTFQEDNQAEHNVASRNNNDESFMNTFGRATELKKPVDVDNALMDLFVDVRGKVKSGTLAQSDVVKMKELYPEFANMGDDVILSMIGDMASIANKNMPFNNENMAKFKSLYPELTAASWGFDKGSSENMYQAGGMREQMAQSSKTDLNRFGTAGALAEGVINPLGEVTTLADMGAQMIPQVDGSGNENRLKKALSKLTDEDINKYYEQYQNYVKNHGTLSNLYTLQLEGDTVVEQLWNWATGKGKKDVDAGFRDWLIDRVNNEVNGWAGEVTGAANDLKGVGGPNIAKMYANMPASTVKTITAITRAITNPVDTAAGLYHLFGTEEGRQALIARYGSWDGFAKALEQDPVGVASDGLAVVEGGAGLTKMATGGLSKASLLAGLSTEALGAARTTENLLKLATRLENMAIKAGKVEKTAGLASNLGADLPINKVINGLRTWGESGESLIQKASKYTANNATTGVGTIAGKVVDTGKDIIKKGPISSLADLLMGSATDSDKLFKAASPNINRLSNNVDYKNKRAKMDLAEQAIVDAGYLPKSISEWAKAHTETLNKKWNEFKQMVADKGDVMVDVRDILKEVKDYIKSEKDGATELQKQDLRKLEVEVAALERMGKIDMNFIEKRKEHYNSSWRDSDKLKVGDVYLKGIKMIGNAMRKQQDNILGKGPESTKKLRKEIAALMDTKNDVIKADVRNQKKKSDISGGGLVESYGRLSGLGDVIGGVVGGVLGKGGEGFAQAGKGIGKMVLGKAMGRAKDVDYLTKKGFEGLSKKKKAQNPAGLQSKFKDSKELGNLYVERDNLRKELKKDNISDSRKEEINKRLDDIEYAIAQKKARAGLGDKERVLSEENKKKVIDMVSKRAKDVGFTTEVLDGMEKDTQGYTDLRKKLIALEKNPGDTTAQHELFHAFFSVVDNKTKTYILDEAKKILKESGMKDVNAEEWLAESFGIYAKRKQIKLGLIDAPKGFVAKVRNFFQKVYEFMQRFNGDRATINKVFDEVLGDRQMKNGIIDLSDLLGDKEVKVRELGDNGLRNKSVYHGSPADFDKFDSSHMGEGEGAQAHGWGHYVAVEERTGRHYAELNNREQHTYKGKARGQLYGKDIKPDEAVATIIMNWMDQGKSYKEAFNTVKENLKYGIELLQKHIDKDEWALQGYRSLEDAERLLERDKQQLKSMDKLKESDFNFGKNRNLYNLDIPDPVKADTPTGSNYLEEDGKITKSQMEKIYNEVVKEFEKKKEGKAKRVQNLQDGQLRIFKNLIEQAPGMLSDGKGLYTTLSNVLGGQKQASKFLESLGYDGIHYFGGRDGEAYVIFNDNALQIKDHIRYKKKIGDKDVEINKDITSPEQMAKVNSKGLSVIHDFISEKQAEKALDVSKDILDKDGNAYLWTHTNKYNAPQFANFENAKDSKYKEFTNNEIAWFSNSEEMSKSYAKWESKLADTKPIKSIEEFNDKFSKYDVDGEPYDTEWHKGGDGKEWKYSHKTSIDKEGAEYVLNQYDSESHKYKNLEKLYNEWHNGGYDGQNEKEVIDGIKKLVHEEFIDDPDFHLYDDVEIKKEKDGYVLTTSSKKELGRYKSEQDALAQSTAKKHLSGTYHYQGIIQNMKNPLVVDLGKYPKGAFLTSNAADLGDTGRLWNDLGNAYDFLKKNSDIDIEATTKAIRDEFKKAIDNKDKIWNGDLLDKIEEERPERYMEYKKLQAEGNYVGAQKVQNWLLNLTSGRDKIENLQYGIVDKLTPEEAMIKIGDTTLGELYKKSKKAYDKYSEIYDLWRDAESTYKKDHPIGGGVYGEKYRSLTRKNLISYLKKKGFDAGALSMMLHDDNLRLDLGWLASYDLSELLKNKKLQTNDYVFYALNKGGYDGVLFKDIVDYGHSTKDIKGGDVLAAFNSKQFKAWDNANPTDSKYISYKKKVSLDKKPEGLSKKDSNGLLSKGRERTLGNNGMRYKKSEVPEDKKLIGLHNLNINKLKGAIELGGMPMPSIAVTKKGVPHESYGDITFIMKESAINPALSKKNKLYTVDGYTPTAPQTITKVKDTKEADALMDRIQKETGIGYGELMQWLEYHDERYFEDYPKLKKFDKYYDQLTEKKLWGGYTPSGKRKYLDYNLDNLVKQMTGNKRNAFNGSYWKMVAQSQGTATIDKLRERKYGLKNEEAANQLHSKYFDAIADLYEKVGGGQGAESLTDYGRFADEIADAYRPNTDAWFKELTQWEGVEGTKYAKIKKEDLQKLQDIVKEGADLARPYSEAKPERAIRFDEVGAVVAPEGKLKEVKDMLKDTGLKVYGYKEGERMSVVDKVADDNGLRFKKVYHGGGDFDKFDLSHAGEGEGNSAHGWGVYVTENQARAKEYGSLYRDRKYGKYYFGARNDRFVTYKGKKMSELRGEENEWLIKDIMHGMQEENNAYPYYDAESQIAKIKNGFRNQMNVWAGRGENAEGLKADYEKKLKALDSINPKDFKFVDAKRNLYDVEIPDPKKADTPTLTNYLEEGDKISNEAYKLINKQFNKETGLTMKRWSKNVDGKEVYDRLSEGLGSKKKASEFLNDMGYDGIHYIGKEDGSSYVLFDDKTPQIKNTIRYKKGLEKKADGLEKKKTSTASAFQGRVDSLASRLGVKGGNTVQKMKRINKIIKEDKYKGTDVKKEFYQLKWEYKKQYIINNNKKIKDKGFKKTTIRVWQNGKKADWHFTKKQYDELKELGYIE